MPKIQSMTTRRQFVVLFPPSPLAGEWFKRGVSAPVLVSDHPTPRPGITAAKVLTKDQLGEQQVRRARVLDLVREIPEIVDVFRCQCGCPGARGEVLPALVL